MTIDKFSTARVQLFYSGDPSALEIPAVEDVLFALRLSEMQENLSSDEIYADNVNLVVAAIGAEVATMKPYNEALVRKIIAKVIVDLCPYRAKCLLNSRFVDARIAAGEKNWEVTKNFSEETLLKACLCPRHMFKSSEDQEETSSVSA